MKGELKVHILNTMTSVRNKKLPLEFLIDFYYCTSTKRKTEINYVFPEMVK